MYLNTLGSKVNTLDYNQLTKELSSGNVTEINVTPKSGSGVYVITGKLTNYKKNESFKVSVPYTDTVISSIYESAESNTEGKVSRFSTSDSSNSVVVPQTADTQGDIVWVPTNGGKKYHSNSYCSNMKNPMQVTREHAEANGYTPCKKCY